MRKRVRKKKHVGEFQEFGVELSVALRPGTNIDAFLDQFIMDAVEANGLAFGGGGREHALTGVLELGRRDAARGKLERVKTWLLTHPGVASFQFDAFIDVWSGCHVRAPI